MSTVQTPHRSPSRRSPTSALGADGGVTLVVDAALVLETYLALCEAGGHDRFAVIGLR